MALVVVVAYTVSGASGSSQWVGWPGTCPSVMLTTTLLLLSSYTANPLTLMLIFLRFFAHRNVINSIKLLTVLP